MNRRLGFVLLLAVLALAACTAGQRTAVSDFFGGFFSSAAPVANAAGQPWLGALLGWAGHALLEHPYESAGATLAAAVPVNHWINGTPGTKRRRNVREIRVAKKDAGRRTAAQMRLLDADVEHRKAAAQADAKVRRALAKKNAALLAARPAPIPAGQE